jgi:hypothetical protein
MRTECNQFVFGFHPLKQREIRAQFDGGAITSDGGGLLLREVEKRIGMRAVDRLLVQVFLEAHRGAPQEIILDLDATDDPLHGKQEGRTNRGASHSRQHYSGVRLVQWFFVWGNDLERALFWTERRAVQCVGDDDFRVHEVTVQLGQGEDDAISVGCFCQDIGSHCCTAEAVTLRDSRTAQEFLQWNAFVNFGLFLVRVEYF